MAVDIKTLRIGSHVLVDGVRAEIVGMDMPRPNMLPEWPLIRCKGVVDGETRYCGGNPLSDEIQPIPITAELLAELGFEWREDSSCWRKKVDEDYWIFTNGMDGVGWQFLLFPPYEKIRKRATLYADNLHEIEGQLAYYGVELIKE